MENSKEIRVETEFGTIVVEEFFDLDYPGIWVDLVKPDGCCISLVAVEETKNFATGKPMLRSIIWGDEADEDPTDIIKHKLIRG
jgi:hypothetical protein